MYDQEHPAYAKLAAIGREITTKVKPRAVVVFSAHWQAGRDTIQVNTAEMTDLIYEYVISDSISSTYSRLVVVLANRSGQFLRLPVSLLQGDIP